MASMRPMPQVSQRRIATPSIRRPASENAVPPQIEQMKADDQPDATPFIEGASHVLSDASRAQQVLPLPFLEDSGLSAIMTPGDAALQPLGRHPEELPVRGPTGPTPHKRLAAPAIFQGRSVRGGKRIGTMRARAEVRDKAQGGSAMTPCAAPRGVRQPSTDPA